MVRHGCFSTSSTHLPSSLVSTVLQFHIEAELTSFFLCAFSLQFLLFPSAPPLFVTTSISHLAHAFFPLRETRLRSHGLGKNGHHNAAQRARLGSRGGRLPKTQTNTVHRKMGEKERGENTSARKREEKSGGAARALSGKRRADRTDGHPPATGIHTISHSPSQRESLLSCATTTDCKKKIRAERTETGLAMLLWALLDTSKRFFSLGPSRTPSLAFSVSLKSRHLSTLFCFSNSFAISRHAKFHGVSYVLACVFTAISIPNVSLSFLSIWYLFYILIIHFIAWTSFIFDIWCSYFIAYLGLVYYSASSFSSFHFSEERVNNTQQLA